MEIVANGVGDLGAESVTVNNGGTLGGNSTSRIVNRGVLAAGSDVTVAAGGNFAPGNGGNNTAILTVRSIALQAASNFRIDIWYNPWDRV
jgi:hypothetical protein